MAKAQAHDDSRNDFANDAGSDDRVLVDRLVRRQGLSRDEAVRLLGAG